MDENMQLPKRLAESIQARGIASDALPAMTKLVEHRRSSYSTHVQHDERRALSNCVQVQLWVDGDGNESIVVVGDANATPLEIKGLLHDGLYAVAHAGEPGFAPTPTEMGV